MASPSVVTSTQSSAGSDTTSHTVTMPSGVVSGNLLLAAFSADGNVTVTWPAGWTEIFEDQAASNFATLAVAYRQSDGTEGASITVTTSGSEESAHAVYRITDHQDPASQAPEVSTGATGTSTTPNPDSLTPTGGAKDYLWFAIAGNDDDRVVSVYPTNYINTRNSTSSTGFGTCTVSAATRALNATSEDPGTFTLTGSEAWVACTVAVYPAFSGLTADAASYAWTGQAAGLLEAHLLAAAAGSYAWSGQDATLTVGIVLTAEAGSYAWSGQDAGLLTDTILVAGAASYSWAGQDAALSETSVSASETGGGWLSAEQVREIADRQRRLSEGDEQRRVTARAEQEQRRKEFEIMMGLREPDPEPETEPEPEPIEELPPAPPPVPRGFADSVAQRRAVRKAKDRLLGGILREGD